MTEPVLFDLSRSSEVYRKRRHILRKATYLYPSEARAAMLDMMPWEAFGLSLAVAIVGSLAVDVIDAGSLGLCIGLALVTVQLMRERAFLTARSIVRRRGLFLDRGFSISIADVREVSVRAPAGVHTFGELQIQTASGAVHRLPAVPNAEAVADFLRQNAGRRT